MTEAHLLPSSSSQIERDLSLSGDVLPRVGSGVPLIRTAKRLNIPDNVVPWLIEEYGLGEITPYVPDLRRALAEGIQWQRVRGTRRAIETALGWIDFPASIEESEASTLRWAEWQLGTEPPDDHSQIDNVVGVSRLSQPVRSRLFRIYGGYDYRRFKLNDHLLSEGSWLCDHTGVYVNPDWPQLSFGRNYELTGTLGDPDFHFCLSRFWPAQAWSADIFRLDIATLQEEQDAWHAINHPGIHGRLYGNQNTDQLQTEQVILPALKFCKAEIVLSDSWVLGDTNACFPAYFEEEEGDGIFTLSSDDKLSEHLLSIVRKEWLERFDVAHPQAAEYTFAPQVSGDIETHSANAHILLDSFILSQDYLDEKAPPVLAEPAIQHRLHMEAATYGERKWGAFEWPAISWEAPPAVVTSDLESFCLGQIILSEQGELGDTNACFPTMFEEEQGDEILHLSEDELSETVLKLVQVEVLQRHDRSHAGDAANPYTPQATGDIATFSSHHITVVDTFFLDRDILDEAEIPATFTPLGRAPVYGNGFAEPYGVVYGPTIETTVFGGITYAGLSADGSVDRRYTATSVYNTPASHLGIIAPTFTGDASFPDLEQVWTSAAWPPTNWLETQIIVGSTHATT